MCIHSKTISYYIAVQCAAAETTIVIVISSDEDDLDIVVAAVHDVADAELLGLSLGIRLSALDKIKVDYPQVEGRKTRVIHSWIKRNDIVQRKQNEHPTWDALADALASLDLSLSERIRDQYC